MSLITCCPACGTMFKVVPDQLRISEGWVRCGHCAEVFDATAHLQNQEQAESQQPTTGETGHAEAPLVEAQLQRYAADDGPEATASQEQVDEALADKGASAFVNASSETSSQRAPVSSSYPAFVLVRPDTGQAGLVQPFAEPEPEPEPEAASEPEPALHDIPFVRHARRKAFWRRPGVRAALVLLALLLGVLLPLQWAFQERDRLAAMQPALRFWLEMLCQPLECTVGPRRQIEAIVIDSSSFNKLRSDAYRLNFTLKNQAATEVAMPAIELTLTDTQDQPVVRRVLTTADLGASSEVIPAAAEWSSTLTLSVAVNGSVGRIAGYRLLAFYP